MRMSIRVLSVACAAALSLTVLGGCSGDRQEMDEAAKAQADNRHYMATVNQTMIDLNECLDEFSTAVAARDNVTMRVGAAEAQDLIDDLVALTPPEALKDVHEAYAEGCEKLDGALDAFIQLYTDMQGDSVTSSSYKTRLASIQSDYDDGMAKLAEGDKLAAEKE